MDQKGGYPRDNQPPPPHNFDYQQPPPAYSDLPGPPQIGFQNPHQQQFQQSHFHPNQFPHEPIVQQPTIVQSNIFNLTHFFVYFDLGFRLILAFYDR